jgi:hypothetical protein
MRMTAIAFGITDWSAIEPTEHPGETGSASWRTCQFGPIRVRMVEYSPGYRADHWCSKGHVVLCIAGELRTELADGRVFVLTPGMSYQVADEAEAHRSVTAVGAKLLAIMPYLAPAGSMGSSSRPNSSAEQSSAWSTRSRVGSAGQDRPVS